MSFWDILLLDTKEIKKDNSTYYVVIVYIPSFKESLNVFVDKKVYDYMVELPSFENISSFSTFTYDRKTGQFRLSFNIENM